MEAAADAPALPSPAKRPPSPARPPAEDAGGSPPKKPARGGWAAKADPPPPPPSMRKPRAAHTAKLIPLYVPEKVVAAGAPRAPRAAAAAPKATGSKAAATAAAPPKKTAPPPPAPKRVPLKAYRRPDGLTFPVGTYAYVALTQEAAEAVGTGGKGGGEGGNNKAPPALTHRQRFQAGQLGLVRIDAVWREASGGKGKGKGKAATKEGAPAGPPPPPLPLPPPAYKFRGGWVLPPEATHAGRGGGHGAREVFISSEHSTNDAACLVGPALVVRERDFGRAPGDDVFYAKYEYNATWQVREAANKKTDGKFPSVLMGEERWRGGRGWGGPPLSLSLSLNPPPLSTLPLSSSPLSHQSFRLIDAKYADDGEDADPEAAAAAAGGAGAVGVEEAGLTAATAGGNPLAVALARAALAARISRAPVRPLPAPRRKGEAVAAAAGGGNADGGWGGGSDGGAQPAPSAGGAGASSSDAGASSSDEDGDWAPGGQPSLFDAWAKGGVRVPRGGGAGGGPRVRRGPPRRIRQGGGALGGALGASAAVLGGKGDGAAGEAAAGAGAPAPAPATTTAPASARPLLPPSTALARARSALAPGAPHCGLPTREGELARLDEFVRAAAAEGGTTTGRCLYVYGVPGTGKTAAVRDAVKRAAAAAGRLSGAGGSGPHSSSLSSAALQADPATRSHHPSSRAPRPFRFVEVNALRLPSPRHVYTRLVEAMDGVRLTPADAHDVLAARFGGSADGGGGGADAATTGLSAKAAAAVRAASSAAASSARPATIVLVDEMDLLLTKSQAVLYNLFEWPTRPGSGLAVIGVANTMDLPDRLLPRIASRLGGRRLPFAPYTAPQLRAILETRLAGAGAAAAFDPRAVLFAARKVAGAAGDVRRALELCRLAADVAAEEGGEAGKAAPSSALVVTMAHVDAAARAMHGASHVQLLAGCAPLDLVCLVSLAVEARTHGGAAGGAPLAAVVARTRELCGLAGGLAGGDGGAALQPTEGEVDAAAARLCSMGLVIADGGGPVVGRRFLHLALDAPLPDLVAVVKARAGAEAGLAWLGRVQLE